MVFRFGHFELNGSRYELTRDGEPVPAEPKVIEVLAYLLDHRDRVVPKDELLGELWDDVVVSESALTQTIKKARELLGDASWIKTIYGRGYAIDGEVEAVESEPPTPAGSRTEVPTEGRRRWRTPATLLALTALLVAVLALLRTTPDPETVPALHRDIRSLAVLPLLDLTTDGEDYFAVGLTEALINRLARVEDLRVISRTSALRYKDAQRPLPEIARELGVEAVLEGSVLQAGGRVRISVQLLDAIRDETLWAQEYERELGDILGLQAEIARAVARAVALRLTSDEAARLAASGSVDFDAYRLYLLGRFHINRRTIEDLEESVELLGRAIDIDPGFAPAHAALADAYILLSTYYARPPAEAFPEARAAAEEALALDPLLSEAHASLGMVSMALEWDFAAAEASYRKALELAPGNATAHQWYGELLSVLGRHEEAVAQGRRAWQLDPLSPIINAALGQRLNAAGRWRGALDQFAATLELEPRFAWIHRERAYAFVQLGDVESALAERIREMEVRNVGAEHLGVLHQRLADDGMRGFWRWELERLSDRARDAYVPALLYAEAHQGLGETETAVSHLLEALNERGDHVLQLATSPDLQQLARRPELRQPLREAGLGHLTSHPAAHG